MDYAGQKLAEQLLTRMLLAFAFFSFVVGYWKGSFVLMAQINGVGLALTLLAVVPDWPWFNKHPVTWLPPVGKDRKNSSAPRAGAPRWGRSSAGEGASAAKAAATLGAAAAAAAPRAAIERWWRPAAGPELHPVATRRRRASPRRARTARRSPPHPQTRTRHPRRRAGTSASHHISFPCTHLLAGGSTRLQKLDITCTRTQSCFSRGVRGAGAPRTCA
jgi:signal peptidase complex subunit 1